jgi:hypothetical protein
LILSKSRTTAHIRKHPFFASAGLSRGSPDSA